MYYVPYLHTRRVASLLLSAQGESRMQRYAPGTPLATLLTPVRS
jgi:hypothetical protein